MFFKKALVSFVLLLSLLINPILVYGVSLIPSGESIGIKLNYEGVIITGSYPIEINGELYNPLDNGLKVNDIITHLNDSKTTTLKELSDKLKYNFDNNIDNFLTVKSNNNTFIHRLLVRKNQNDYNTGLYVKDSLMGIGTMTYYNPVTNSFGSLGHGMIETELGQTSYLKNGEIYKSTVTGLIKGTSSNTGQKIADINNISIGEIDDHSQFGIYGTLLETNFSKAQAMETASIEEIKLGSAYFLTVLENNEITKCNIEITNLEKQINADIKGIEFQVIDNNIKNKTNGIIQGMSGSPIIQNNKIIGCVTHVSTAEPTKGYGLYIDWMLEMDNRKK